MGYHIREGLVEEHTDVLEMILTQVEKGESTPFDCTHAAHMSKMKYQFNRVLRAATILKDEAGGRYTHLRERVTVREDWNNLRIVIEPKQIRAGIHNVVPSAPNESDMLTMLSGYKGTMPTMQFRPSPDFTIEAFASAVSELGYVLAASPESGEYVVIELDNGQVMMTANRAVERKPSVLEQFGFASSE